MSEEKSIGYEISSMIIDEARSLQSDVIKNQSTHLDNLEDLIKTARLKLK